MPYEPKRPQLPPMPEAKGLLKGETIQIYGPGQIPETDFGAAPFAAYSFSARLPYPQAGISPGGPLVIVQEDELVVRGSCASVMDEDTALAHARSRLAGTIDDFVEFAPTALRIARLREPRRIEGREGRYNDMDVQGTLYVRAH